MPIPKITFIMGTRPEVIRFAPVLLVLKERKDADIEILHTGQHYSPNMRESLLEDLKLNVDVELFNLEEKLPYAQVSEMIMKLGKHLDQSKPDIVCVWGDTNSSFAGAIAANKLKIKLCHIESGCRSFDRRMPEEHNRIMIDVISDLLMPLSFNDKENLENERVQGKIEWVGDPLFDIFMQETQGLVDENADSDPYCLVTIHRAENVDNKDTLKRIFTDISEIKNYKIIFPMHPRTVKMSHEFGITDLIMNNPNVVVLEPLSYHELLKYLVNAKFVITDSGGLQKEAYFASKPCITTRKSTEWLDTSRLGVNIVLDPESEEFHDRFSETISNIDKIGQIFTTITEHPYGKGEASVKVSDILIQEAKNV